MISTLGKMTRDGKPEVVTALKTPHRVSGDIDYQAYARLIERQIAAGITGLIIGGTTGEGHLMDCEELGGLIRFAVEQCRGRIAVIGNTGAISTRKACQLTQRGFDDGMDAALIVNPYYGRTSHAGLHLHYQTLLDIGPLIAYHVPVRTGQPIPLEVLASLSSHANFKGVKECDGPQRIADLVEMGIPVWSGNDDSARNDIHQRGATGVMSVVANVAPQLAVRHFSDNADAPLLEHLIAWMAVEPNPIPVNTALAMAGLAPPVFKLPGLAAGAEAQQRLAPLLAELASHETGIKHTAPLQAAAIHYL